jgi:hypothetical protein
VVRDARRGLLLCLLRNRCRYRMQDADPVCGFFEDRYRVPGIGYRLSGTWDLVPGTGAGPTPGAEHRAPKTEPGYRKTRTSGMLSAG